MMSFGEQGKKKDDDILNELKMHRESHLEMIKTIALVGTNLNKIQTQLEKLLDTKVELRTIPQSPSSVPYTSEGYRFNSIFVSDAQGADALKLIVSVDGLSYTTTLQPGENIINIPDRAEISVTNTSVTAASLVFCRFNIAKS